MLVEFSVSNFRSIREKQTLSMVANASTDLEDTNILQTGRKDFPRLLPCAVIYGPNASGKSNLIKALGIMRNIILESAEQGQVGKSIKNIEPHALAQDKPTEFEIIFIADNERYQYGFAATAQQIVEEWLFVFKTSRAQRWLERSFDKQQDTYAWYINPDKVKGDRDVWKRATRNNALFVSTAAQLNSQQFKTILGWFQIKLAGEEIAQINTLASFDAYKSGHLKSEIQQFLNAADLNITDIQITQEKYSVEDTPILKKLAQDIDETWEMLGLAGIPKIKLSHATEKGESFYLDISKESDGTCRIFELSSLWLTSLNVFGGVILMDELNDSLHPALLRYLVNFFHDVNVNKQNAQLIFTTHDTTILDTELLRRDQIWFIEKDNNQNSQLYSLSDFKPRKNEALQKHYLQGRYGALPFIDHLFK